MSTESKIDQVKMWLKDFARAGANKIHIKQDTGWNNGERFFKVLLYTAAHIYTISTVDRNYAEGYIGCMVKCRYPLLGEHWRRGNDLADGPLIRETWEKIKDDIIAYELVKPAPEQTANTATLENLTHALRGVLNAIEEASSGLISSSSIIPTSSSAPITTPPPVSGPPLPLPINRAPIYISPKTKENAIDFLQPILKMVPVEMLPEIIVSEDNCLSAAAARCAEQHAQIEEISRESYESNSQKPQSK